MKEKAREGVKIAAYGLYRGLHLDAVLPRRGFAYVLNLHRVHPRPSPYWPPMRPDDLDWLVSRLKRIGTFVSVEEVSSQRVPRRARLFALSFDDGYDDFLSHALPVIESHGVPVNLNVVGSSLATGEPIWNARLYEALGRNTAGVSQAVRRLVPTLGTDPEALSRADLGLKLADHLRERPADERLALLDRIVDELRVGAHTLGVVTAQDVRNLPDFVHLGSHSYSHEPMAAAPLESFLSDLEACRRLFREQLHRPLTTYAFPLGAYRQEQIGALLANGVERVLLVDERPAEGGGPVIPRLTVGGTMRGQFLAKSTAAGMALRRHAG